VDEDEQKVKLLNNGVAPLFEPGLNGLISRNISQKRLKYTTDLASALKGADFVLITFDTPVDENDEIDLTCILKTTNSLSNMLEPQSIVIICSQVPVGTCNKIKSVIQEKNSNLLFDVAYVPENLRLGQAISRFIAPEALVFGADNNPTLDRVDQFFSIIKCPKIKMDLRSAEMSKHALNAYLATSISFANEIGNLCDAVGADMLKVAEALRLDSRIGAKALLNPGLGFSGGTLARDVKVLQKLGKEVDVETQLINGVIEVNQKQNKKIALSLEKLFGKIENRTITILGLTYKAGTSTLRRSVSLEIIRDLVARGAKIKAYDPMADLEELKSRNFDFCDNPIVAAEKSDAVIFITEWPEFKSLDFIKLKSVMKNPVIIDPQNILDGNALRKLGFTYLGTGRGTRTNLKLDGL
jgi:UDPglucose 6-dehydrogenase